MIWFYWVTAFLSHITPEKVAVFITERIADLMYFTLYRKQRKTVMSNIKMVYRQMESAELKETALKIYRNFARFIYEFLILPKIDKDNLFNYLEIINKERLDDAVNRKSSGVLVLTAHLGNWELGAAMLSILGYSPTVIALAQPSRYIRDFFTKRREAVGMKIVYLGEKMRDVITALTRKGVVATLGDRTYSGVGIKAKFFGKPIYFPYGVFELASRTNSTIIPAFCVRDVDKYRVYFEPPIKNGVEEWAKVLEQYIKRYITQWFVFEPLWA
ncbi:MAG: lysophospholipid acyltransferase family protein [bacterium]|nr:lysophospholipid acyltransferase family protein [bacterium]